MEGRRGRLDGGRRCQTQARQATLVIPRCKIHEELKNKPQAIENYQKFLDLWEDVDPGFPEVEDTKIRLASLR
jgi:hypothetical protein